MMNILLKLLVLHIILSSAFGAEKLCEDPKILTLNGKKVTLCFTAKENLYLSLECSTVESCFKIKDLDLSLVPDQSPGFSLCFQSGGKPFLGAIGKVEEKIPFCEFKGRFADQENLMRRWKAINKSL
jgi:hypothetical protein